MEPLYLINITCACCSQEFQTSKVRYSMRRPVKTDSDYCTYYKEINPDYYLVRVCPHCNYAATEHSNSNLDSAQKEAVIATQICYRAKKDYTKHRSWQQALEAYQLALVCAQAIQETPRLIAGLLHHIAWLYREKAEVELERRFLQFSLETYIEVYETEQQPMNVPKLLYLIGELYRRVGDENEAAKWLSRVIFDNKITDANIIRIAKEQWVLLRSAKELKGEKSEC